MGKEYEAKFLDINYKKMCKILKEIGAKKLHKLKMFRRKVYFLCDAKIKGYARVRDEGGPITMTSKIYIDPKFPEENEVEIKGTFEDGCNFIESLGLKQKAYQQTYREKWTHKLAHEITFDYIPGIPMYMEVDCRTEDNLNKLIDTLKLDKSKMRFGAFDATYEEYYGITKDTINNNTPSLTFKNILKEIKPLKNKELLNKIYKTYKFNKNNIDVDKFLELKI
jgi:adenylate cyclase class IV